MRTSQAYPKVLIIIPCLNEAAHIGGLLLQISKQRTDMDALLVVADGGSTDGTQEIVKAFMKDVPDLLLLHNPKRLQSAALNLAVEKFGNDRDYVIRIDAHGAYPEGYCQALLQEAIEMGCDSVVVGMQTTGFGTFQKATALAQNSKLGNGGSKHRDGAGGQWVDHGHHALMRIKAFRAVGGYDEKFSHNEDAELDFRLRGAGFKIWMTGKTYMTYFPRSNAPALFRQYFAYGRGRARNMRKNGTIPKVRQAILLAVAPATFFAVFAIFSWWAAAPFFLWASACIGYGLWLALGQRNGYGLLASFSAMIMHFAWSAGFWREFLNVRAGRPAV